VALTYETLDHGKQRRIWDGFLKKLADERKDITLTDRAKKFIEGLDKNETTKDVPWNGREIRNGSFNTQPKPFLASLQYYWHLMEMNGS
jgi:hypothetical protein